MSSKKLTCKHILNALSLSCTDKKFSSLTTSINKKLNNEINLIDNRFVDNETILKMPSMGVIKLVRERKVDPIYLFGTDISTTDLTIIKLYEAEYNKVTKQISPTNLLAEVYMSEMQFAKIALMSGQSNKLPATLNTYNGKSVKPYDLEKDISKQEMSKIIESSRFNNDQVDRFISETTEIINQGQKKGSLSRENLADIKRKLNSIVSYTVSQATYGNDVLNRALSDRVREASLNIHNKIKSIGSNTVDSGTISIASNNENYADLSTSLIDKLTREELALIAFAMYEYLKPFFKNDHKQSQCTINISGESIELTTLSASSRYSSYEMERFCQSQYGKDSDENIYKSLFSFSINNYPENNPYESEDSNVIISSALMHGKDSLLFDNPNKDTSFISMNISKSEFINDNDEGTYNKNKFRPIMGDEILTFGLSCDQYVKFMSSDYSEVSCTILRSHGEYNETPDIQNKNEIENSNLKIDILSILSDVDEKINTLLNNLPDKAISGKGRIKEISESFKDIADSFSANAEEIIDKKQQASYEIANININNLKDNAEYELSKLPLSKRESAKKNLIPMLGNFLIEE